MNADALRVKVLSLTVVVFSGVMLVPVAGCQAAAPQPVPIATAQGDQEPVSPGEDEELTRGPDGVLLFGDEPEDERVPFENRLVTNLSRHTFTTEGLDFDPDVLDSEELLVFASTRHALCPDIYLKRIDGATITQLTSDPADDIQPRFKPDGKQVVFCSNRSGNWDIWLVDRGGTGLTQLTSDPADEMAPCWSADGTQIAYTIWGPQSHQWEIWTLSVDQPGVRRFLAYGMFPAWSPDGNRIAFQRARQRGSHLFSVWIIDLVDGEARHPTEVAYRESAACIAPRWAPAGNMLVYCIVNGDGVMSAGTGQAPSSADLWVVELESGLRMKLTDGADPAFNPVWADGGRVFFVSPRSGTENVWSLTTEVTSYASGAGGGAPLSRARPGSSSWLSED